MLTSPLSVPLQVGLAQVAEHNLALDLAPVIEDTVNKLCRFTGAEEEVYDLPYKLDVAQLVSKGTEDSESRFQPFTTTFRFEDPLTISS